MSRCCSVSTWCLCALTTFLVANQTQAQDFDRTTVEFDWATHRTSPADLLIRSAGAFQQRRSGLGPDEQQAWHDLLEEVIVRHQAVRDEYKSDAASRWESAFYRYADVRQRAWQKGSIIIYAPQKKLDPFRQAKEAAESNEPYDDSQKLHTYSLLADILAHPEAFVGKPVAIRGILQRPIETATQPSDQSQSQRVTLSLGDLYSMSGDPNPIAVVHTRNVERTSGEHAGITSWPRSQPRLPVLVKGWVVKLWDDRRPLIYCESVQELKIQPPTTLIRQHTIARQPLQQEESWLYYSTLKTLEVVSELRRNHPKVYEALFADSSMEKAASQFHQTRLRNLISQIFEKARSDELALETQLETRQITVEEHAVQKERLLNQVQERRRRYDEATETPNQFDTYVDLFLNPDVWQGQLVTLRGHVRHVVSYPAGHPEFNGRRLYELWLYTEDSQSNPAVIVTPSLPDEFPVDADLIDHVSVTGCVFKEYVYNSQENRRVAPLILAGEIQWSPTDKHLVALRNSGHLAAGSPLDQRAQLSQTKAPPVTSLLVTGFVAMLVLMILWGREQRDRRERRNLLKRISEKPEFESSLDGGYAPRLSDYTSGYEL